MSLVKYLNGLWSKSLWLEFVHDLHAMFVDMCDFTTFNSATSAVQDWVETQATAGTAALVAGLGGILELDSASSTADQGIQIQRPVAQFYPAAGKDIFFECRIALTDIGANGESVQAFAGLATVDTTLFNAGVLSATDYIGFSIDAVDAADSARRNKLWLKCLSGGSGTPDEVEVCDLTGSVAPAAVTALEWFRLGFHVYYTPSGNARVQAYVDGVKVGDPLDTEIPSGGMSISFACLSEGTTDPIMYVDWYRVAQIREP